MVKLIKHILLYSHSLKSQTLFSWAPKSLQMVTAAMKLKILAPWKKSYDKPRQHIKKQRHYFANKCPSSQTYGFSSSHIWMWVLDYSESWALTNWCFWTVVLEKTLESLLDCKEIKPVSPKWNQFEYSLEGLMLKLKFQYFGHLMLRIDSLEKTLILGKIESRKRRGWQRMMFGWHHWLNGYEFGQALRDGEEQGGLVCCSSWGHKELDMTEPLNWTELMQSHQRNSQILNDSISELEIILKLI